jgi:hypothetical protein
MKNFDLPSSFFCRTGERQYNPTEATIGPWSSDLQHGGPPCALLTNALHNYTSPEDLKIARITIEFFSAVPVKPCEIKVKKVRSGKKVELLQGEYISGGYDLVFQSSFSEIHDVGRTSTLFESLA